MSKAMSAEEHDKKYPTAAKWASVFDEARSILNFKEWEEGEYDWDDSTRAIDRVYRYFDIDGDKLEQERSDMLKAVQDANG